MTALGYELVNLLQDCILTRVTNSNEGFFTDVQTSHTLFLAEILSAELFHEKPWHLMCNLLKRHPCRFSSRSWCLGLLVLSKPGLLLPKSFVVTRIIDMGSSQGFNKALRHSTGKTCTMWSFVCLRQIIIVSQIIQSLKATATCCSGSNNLHHSLTPFQCC